MAGFRWREIYSIGITLIDEQHKKLVGLIEKLSTARAKGVSQIVLQEVLDELVDYTNYHFSDEENMLRMHHYPDIEKHIEEHEGFKYKIEALKNDARSGNLIVSMKTLEYLQDWTIDHILGSDKEYAEYMRSKEIGEKKQF